MERPAESRILTDDVLRDSLADGIQESFVDYPSWESGAALSAID